MVSDLLLLLPQNSYEDDFDWQENETACRTHFHIKGFVLRLVLKQRCKRLGNGLFFTLHECK